MYIGRQFAGKCFRDCMRKVRDVVTEAAYEYLVINED